MYSQIINPQNGNKVSVNSKLGREIINNYMKALQKGGAALFPERGTIYGVLMTHLGISPNYPAQIKYMLSEGWSGTDTSYPLNTFDYLMENTKQIKERGEEDFVNEWFFEVPDNITVFFATPVGECALASDTEEKILTALSMDINLGRDSGELVSKSLSKFLYQYATDPPKGGVLEHHDDLNDCIRNMGEYSGGDIIMDLKVDLGVPSDKWNIFLKETGSRETHIIFNDKRGAYQGYYKLAPDITKRRRNPRRTSSPIWEKLSANHSYLLSDILKYISMRWHDKHIELWVQGCNVISHTSVWMEELAISDPKEDIATTITNISELITDKWEDIMLDAKNKFLTKAGQAPVTTRSAAAEQRKEIGFYEEERAAFRRHPLPEAEERTRRRHMRTLRASHVYEGDMEEAEYGEIDADQQEQRSWCSLM